MERNQDIQTILWDIPADKIHALPQEFVIQRALTYGGVRLIVQLIKQYGLPTVSEVLQQMKPTAMPKKKYDYLKRYLLV